MMMDTSMKGWQQRNMPDSLAGNKMELGLQNFYCTRSLSGWFMVSGESYITCVEMYDAILGMIKRKARVAGPCLMGSPTCI